MAKNFMTFFSCPNHYSDTYGSSKSGGRGGRAPGFATADTFFVCLFPEFFVFAFESQFEDHSLRSPLVLSSKSLTAPMNFLGLALHVALGTFTEILGLYWIRSGDGSPDSKTKVSCE